MSTDICRWLFLLFCLTTWANHSNSKEIRVVCYYTNWSVYRPGTAKFSPQNINPYLCTHLVYAFGGFTKENTLKPFDKYQDIEKGGYAKFTGLKTYNKNLKTMLAIGGWNEGSSRFSPMVANPERRKELVKNAIKFLRQNHFDGLDLDWEYPAFRDGGKSRDRDNYAKLVQELREEFDRESEKTGRNRLLLTMAVPAGIEYINKGYDVPKLTKYLDWMNILSYDYHSAFEPAVNHHAPLYSLEEESEYNYDGELNIDYTIKHYLKMGADPSKLVMGIPTYGRSYTLYNPDANEIGSPADGPGDMGDATRENGYLAYYEICDNIKSQEWEVVQPDPKVMGPYAFKENQWVGYDDEAIARKKSEYVVENGLGGIMFWSIDNDDFRGACHGKPYPIIEAAKEALISALGLTDENSISPTSKSLIKSKTRTRPSSVRSTTESENVQLITKRPTRRRNRTKPKEIKPRKETRRTTEAPVYSSLELITPSYTTPAPPSTPDQGGAFKCEDEGFYPHPKDCKKYFWCLSGPGELGIIAHQFTCPAGLYFNKAADSCDYTRNVLCNKKLEKSKPTTTTTEATTSKTTTTRRTTIPTRSALTRTTTTTEAYEDEYEYEDDEENDKNSEEDPKVIKELFDLIRKAGGIEELERQLKFQEEGGSSSNSGATTQSSISKSLVERVLSKAARNGIGKKNTYSVINRNSRGPQNEGLSRSVEKTKESKQSGRLQYTTIARQSRPQNSASQDDEDEDDEDDEDTSPKFKTATHKQYVNIQRGRSTASKDEESKSQINRNKILGEDSDDDTEEEEEEKKKVVSPQYVNIRRPRPSTTEETSTSKYTVIRRGTTESGNKGSENDTIKTTTRRGSTTAKTEEKTTRGTTSTESKYKTIKRGSSTESPVKEVTITNAGGSTIDSSTLKYVLTSDGASTKQSSTKGSEPTTVTDIPETTFLSVSSPGTLSIKTLGNLGFIDVSSTDLPTESTPYGSPSTPILLEPRPFSISTTRGSTLKPIVTESATKTTKVSETSNPKLRVKIDGSTSTEKPPTPFRTRAPSRSRQPNFNNIEQTVIRSTANPSVRSRKRLSTTTEIYSDDEYDLNRSYRPAELADFSSLTAFDFRNDQGLQNSGSTSRRRRLRPPSTTEAVAEEKPVDGLKTSSRTLPLARKQLLGQSFGNSNRRAFKPEIEDQVKSSSDSSSHRVRGIIRTTTPVTTTEKRSTIRGRKVIRRFKPTTEQPKDTRNTSRRRLILRPTTPKTDVIETASTNGLLAGRRFSRPTTVNQNIDLDAKQINDLEKVTPSNFDNNNENSDESTEDGENIKLSESIIRENNDVNNKNVISDDGKPARKVLKRILSKNESKPSVTEPNIIVRTRKIVRKLRPTEPSIAGNTTIESIDTTTVGPRRKIIRRLRPTTEAIVEFGDHSSTVQSTTTESKTLFIRGRPFLIQQSTDDEEIALKASREKYKTSTSYREEKYKTISRPATSQEDLEQHSTTEIIAESTTQTVVDDDDDEIKSTTFSDLKISSLNEIEIPTSNSTIQDITISNSTEDTSNSTTREITISNSTETNLNVTESSEENVTVKNYKNPILDRQKNRPTFRRPSRITTASPVRSSTAQIRFRGRSRGTTTHSTTSVRTEFVPRGRNRFRVTPAPSTTETIDFSPTEAPKEIVTVSEFYTLASNPTEEALSTDINTDSTVSLEEATTVSLEELSTTVGDELVTEIESTTSESATITTSNAVPLILNKTSEAVSNINDETTITASSTSTTEAATVKSILRPLKVRPKYTGLKKLTAGPVETTTAHAKFSPKHISKLYSAKATTPSTFKNRFSTKERKKFDSERNEEKQEEVEDENLEVESENEKQENERQENERQSIEKPRFKPKVISKPNKSSKETDTKDELSGIDHEVELENEKQENERQENERQIIEKTRFKPKVISKPNKSSKETDTKDELSGIDADAVRNRNKNLFSQKRQMNTPAVSSTEAYVKDTETPTVVTTTPAISESVTRPTGIETTTEYPTTLHHIFAETESDNDTNTETSTASLDKKRIEKLIEVSRIVEVHSQEEMRNLTSNDNIVENRIGAINRVTHIEVVDPNPEENELNGTGTELPKDSTTVSDRFLLPEIATVKEISASEIKGSLYNLPDPFAQISRQDRKYEVYANGKTQYNVGKFEIIDGRSHINIITPRPYYSTEASTIALQGLFQTDTPQKLHDLNVDVLKPQVVATDEELLETDNSRYVNVRVLGQDRDDKAIKSEKTVNHDDYITMKAHVVEVTPKSSADTIKIVPIKVEMSRKLINPSDFKTKVEEDVQKVELKVIHTHA